MRKNESGVTLVELLATLVLVTIVTTVIWNTVFISMKYTTAETKKLRLQQEANYVIAEIQRYHRQCDSYDLAIKDNEVTMKNCERDVDPENQIPNLVISNGFRYSSTPKYNIDSDRPDPPIEAKSNDSSLTFTLIVKDDENTKLNVEIPTTVSRYKSE